MKQESRLDEQITPIVETIINQKPALIKGYITKIYPDNSHVDIETTNGVLKYAETISNNLGVGNLGVVLFLNNNFDEYVVITK